MKQQPLKLCDDLIKRCNRLLRVINNPTGPSAGVLRREVQKRVLSQRRVFNFCKKDVA